MAITFYIDLMVGEFMDKDSSGQLKLMIFYSVMFLQGFVNNLLQVIFIPKPKIDNNGSLCVQFQ